MSQPRVYHILPHSGGGWAVTEAGSSVPIIAFHSKDAAVAFAEKLAAVNKPSKLVVYDREKAIEREAEYEES
jgi:hypothetical protein